MENFNTNLTQTIKWLQNNAPNIQSLINAKHAWYQKYNNAFWSNWYDNVFNLDTCDEFGIYVWCEILGIPKAIINLTPITRAFAFGENRQNFVYSGTGTPIPSTDRNLIGGNFFGSNQELITNISEARFLLKLRYAALTSDGRIDSINTILKWILNGGRDWDTASGEYAYVLDSTQFDATAISIQNILNNYSFENDLSNWSSSNAVAIQSNVARTGINVCTNNSAILPCEVNQTVTGLSYPAGTVLRYSVYIRLSPGASIIDGSSSELIFNVGNGTTTATGTTTYTNAQLSQSRWTQISGTVTTTAATSTQAQLRILMRSNNFNGVLFDDATITIAVPNSGSWFVKDWQGQGSYDLDASWRILAGGNNWDGTQTSGSTVPVTSTDMGVTGKYAWTGAIRPVDSPTALLVGGDNRQYNGPDYFGVNNLSGGAHAPGYTNAIMLIRQLDTPDMSTSPPTSEFGYRSLGISTYTPPSSSLNVIYSCFVKQDSIGVKSVMLREYRLYYTANSSYLVDPVRIFVDLETGEYIIRAYNSSAVKSKGRGGVIDVGDGWYRIWFYEPLNITIPAGSFSTGLGIFPLSSAYDDPSPVPLRKGERMMIFGLSVVTPLTPASAVSNPPTAPNWYTYGTFGGTSRVVTYALSSNVATLTFQRGVGNFGTAGLRTGPGSINYSALQPGASISFDGVLNYNYYNKYQPFVPSANGYNLQYRVAPFSNTPQPARINMFMQYVFGPAFNFSGALKAILADRKYGALPSNAGIGYGITNMSNDFSDIDLTLPLVDYRIQYGLALSTVWNAYQYSDGTIQSVTQDSDYWPLQYVGGGGVLGRTFPWLASTEYWRGNASMGEIVSKTTTSSDTVTRGYLGGSTFTRMVTTLNCSGVSSATNYSVAAIAMPNVVLDAPAGDYVLSFTADVSANTVLNVYYGLNTLIANPSITPIATITLTPGFKRYNVLFAAPNGIKSSTNPLTDISIGICNEARSATFTIMAPSIQQVQANVVMPGTSFGVTDVASIPAPEMIVVNPGRAATGFTVHFATGGSVSFDFPEGAYSYRIPNARYNWLSSGVINRISYY